MNAHRHLPTAVLAAAIAFAAVGGATAQPSAKAAPAREAAATENAPVQAEPGRAPFMQPLSRLATILGSVSFLRQLCGDANAGEWRARMDDLLRVQSPSPSDRETLVASYNSGYRSYASVYRRCTPAARVAVARYQDEGAALSRDIATRHGN